MIRSLGMACRLTMAVFDGQRTQHGHDFNVR
jgi:hypothetical protein